MTPRKVSEAEVIVMLREVELYVCAQIPPSGLVVPGEDAQVDAEAVWSDMCDAAILGPRYLSRQESERGTGGIRGFQTS